MNKHLRSLVLACGFGILLTTACTKTDTIAPPELSQSRMLEYKIVNVQGEPITGTIDQADSSITVYIPFYLQLVTLEPQITVAAGATVTPASGTLIEDLMDVFQNGRDIKYIVTGKDGGKSTYTLKIAVQQPPIVLKELSTADNIRNYNIRAAATSLRIVLEGSGFNENRDLMKLEMVDEEGNIYPLGIAVNAFNDTYSININLSKNQPDGAAVFNSFETTKTFRIRVYNYARQAITQYPIRITKN